MVLLALVLQKQLYMQENYTMTKRINFRVSLAVAYSKAIQVIDTKMLKKIILINN